ncbi:hypothetical protein BVY04_01125 [bacterium M21]|nr:hypothetical protein BVY04_01125 [bacterium M21]
MMELFFVEDEEKVGPCDKSEWLEAQKAGRITSETKVWFDGLDDWLSWHDVRQMAQVMAFLGTQHTCCVCSGDFPPESILTFGSDTVCAGCKNIYVQSLKEGVDAGMHVGLRRDGKKIHFLKSMAFPDRCIKCNSPADGYQKKVKLQFTPRWAYLLLVPMLFFMCGLIPLAIVIYLVSKRHTVQVGLCPVCRSRRMTGLLLGWLSLPVIIGGIIAAVNMRGNPAGAVLTVSLIAGVALIAVGIVKSSLLRAKKIEDDQVEVIGAGPKFLDSLGSVLY